MINCKILGFCFISYLLLVNIDVGLGQLNGQEIFDCRTLNNNKAEYSCKVVHKCSNADDLINSKNANICGYEQNNQENTIKICCPEEKKPFTMRPVLDRQTFKSRLVKTTPRVTDSKKSIITEESISDLRNKLTSTELRSQVPTASQGSVLFLEFQMQGNRYVSKETYNCKILNNSTIEYTCRRPEDCFDVNNLIYNSAELKIICGYECEGKQFYQKKCCPRLRTQLSSTKFQILNTTSNSPSSTKNAVAIAIEKCKYYYNITRNTKSSEESTIETIRGTVAEPKEFPHMALIGYGKFNNIQWKCVGSLISENFVLSAAHCSKLENNPQWVRLGDLDSNRENDDAKPVTLRIIEHILHPNYTELSFYNDIALFKLEKYVQFNDYIHPICLHPKHNISDIVRATVSGWGAITESGSTDNNILLRANLFLTPYEDCEPFYDPDNITLNKGIDRQSMICALDEEEENLYRGESGSPLKIKNKDYSPEVWEQIGIFVSLGNVFYGDMHSPAIYTKVPNYIDWIQKHVWP